MLNNLTRRWQGGEQSVADEKKGLYPIGIVEQLVGLTARQIRYYETNGLISPQRTEGRQRLYSDAEIERLKEIKSLMERGMSLQTVKTVLANRGVGSSATAFSERKFRFGPPDPARLAGQKPLTSVYPVSNRAALINRLDGDKESHKK